MLEVKRTGFKEKIMEKKEEELALLQSFSDRELYLNEHKRKDLVFVANIFDGLLGYIKEGKYLELGCGTGMLCKFIERFSLIKVIPYGVDIDLEAIKYVQKHFPDKQNNFITKDYFSLPADFFRSFSTILIFLDRERRTWKKITNLIKDIFQVNTTVRLIIFSYDYDLFNVTNQRVGQFLEGVKNLAEIKKINKRFFIINKIN